MTNAVTDIEKKEKLNIEEVLLKEGKYVGPTSGVSMLPMLKTGRDSVVIRPPAGRLKRLDVALYKRGGDYVLHRVIEVKDGGYVTLSAGITATATRRCAKGTCWGF